MSIGEIKPGIGSIAQLNRYRETQGLDNIKAPEGNEKSFAKVFSETISEVDKLQLQADKDIDNVVLGKSNSPHEAMIALEKADVAFQLMNTIRSKIIRAYEEVLRTQI